MKLFTIFLIGSMGCSTLRGSGDTVPEVFEPHPWCNSSEMSDHELILTTDSFGPVRIGISGYQLSKICPTVRDTAWYDVEGNHVIGSILIFNGMHAGRIEWTNDGILLRAIIHDKRVRTERGIVIGSTVGEIRRKLTGVLAGYDGIDVYVWSDDEPNISYIVDVEAWDLSPSPDDIFDNPGLIPDGAVVKEMIFSSY